MPRITMILPCLLLLLAGCGGGGDDGSGDERAIRTVLDRLQDARARGNGAQACRELLVIRELGRSPELQGGHDAEAGGSGQVGRDGEAGAGEASTCQRDFARTVRLARSGLRSYEERVRAIHVDHDAAVVRSEASFTRVDGSRLTRPVRHQLMRVGAGWRMILEPVG